MDIIPEGVSSKRVCDLIAWADDSLKGDRMAQPLGLPPIQRTALWNPRQIMGLWDSLLRGMPIGVFYLIPAGSERRPIVEKGQVDATGLHGGLDLLDGQQRLRAMLLAVQPPASMGKCLWVDFGAKTDAAGMLVPLRLTTKSQPFGYKDDGTKLSLDERRKSRIAFDKAHEKTSDYNKATFDHQLFELALDGAPPRPASSSASLTSQSALQLTELFKDWHAAGRSHVDFAVLVKKRLKQVSNLQIDSNIRLLSAGFDRLDNAVVAIILTRIDEEQRGEWLLRWFEKIGAGGTALSGPERSYSIYKHYEPRIYNVVSSIESSVGHVMSPVDVVGTALRIAAAEIGNFSLPDHTAFAKAAAEPLKSDLWKALIWLIPEGSSDDTCKLGVAFKKLFSTLRYDEKSNPRGLPALMLAELPSHVLQVLIYWTVRKLDHNAEDLGRDEMVRFALFWFLCSDNQERGGRRAFEFLKEYPASEGTGFPGRALYGHLTGDDRTALSLVRPKDLETYCFAESTYGTWRGWKQLFERPETNVFCGHERFVSYVVVEQRQDAAMASAAIPH